MFTVSSWPTHYSTMIPLGWALQAVGHEVRVLCADSQVEPVSNAGLIPVPVLEGMTVVVRNRLQFYWEAVHGLWPYPWLPLNPMTGAQLGNLHDFDVDDYRRTIEPTFAVQAGRSFDRTVEFAHAWQPDLVLHDPASLEGLLAGRVLHVPSAVCLWGPVGTHEAEHLRIVPEDISDSFRRYGIGPLSLDLIEYVVDPCPQPLAPPTTAARLPVRYVPYNGCAPAPLWLLDQPSRPRVCIAWSTALSTMCGPNSYLLPELIQALLGLDLDIVITATESDVAALGDVPASVRVLQRLPLRLLLPSCVAVIHHGGAGNTMTSLWAGVPQLIVSFASEQSVSGTRVAGAGAGLHIHGHEANRASVRQAVQKLLGTRGYSSNAAALRDEITCRPTMFELVDSLEKLSVS